MKIFLSIIILSTYIATIVMPYYYTTILKVVDPKSFFFILHYGFVHIPSMAFIVTAALVLHWSVRSKANKVEKEHKKTKQDLEEALASLNMSTIDYEKVNSSKNVFCKDIKHVLINGGIEDDMELVIRKHISSITTNYEKLISEYSYIATVLPMLGMIGTITGLLQMFAVGGGVDNFSEKLVSLSIALATTLYATLWVVFVTKPKSREIENWLIEIDDKEYRLVINAKLFMHNIDLMMLSHDTISKAIDEQDNDSLQEELQK